MSLLTDWSELCRGSFEYNPAHFYSLFHEDLTQKDIEEIFSYFESNDDLIKRFTNYRSLQRKPSKALLLQLVENDLESKRKFCRSQGDHELVDLMSNARFLFVDDKEFKTLLNSDLPHIWLMELIGDSLIYSFSESPRNNALIEAFYGLTANQQLVWYLAKPLYNSQYNPDHYFNIWKNSSNYILGNNEIYIMADQNLMN